MLFGGEGLVDQVVDAQFELGAVEVLRERRELAFARDRTPAGAVDGLVVRGAVEMHGRILDAAVGEDRETDVALALLVERGLSLGRDEGVPVALDVGENA